jgi:hypothetical protein
VVYVKDGQLHMAFFKDGQLHMASFKDGPLHMASFKDDLLHVVGSILSGIINNQDVVSSNIYCSRKYFQIKTL